MGPGAPNIGVGAQGRSVWSVWLSSGGVASVAGLITQRSSVQIRPPQPLTTRGERTQEPLTPSLYPDFTQELVNVRQRSTQGSSWFRCASPPSSVSSRLSPATLTQADLVIG